MTQRAHQSVNWVILATYLTLIVVVVVVLNQETTTRIRLTREGAVIETASAVGYFCCVTLLALGRPQSLRSHWYLHGIMLFAGFRELDFHARFGRASMFSLRTYTGDTPLGYKAIGAFVLVALCAMAYYLFKRHRHAFPIAFKSGDAVARLVAASVGLLAIAKVIDGLPARLQDLGASIPYVAFAITQTVEEVFELGIPILLLLAVCYHLRTPGGHEVYRTPGT